MNRNDGLSGDADLTELDEGTLSRLFASTPAQVLALLADRDEFGSNALGVLARFLSGLANGIHGDDYDALRALEDGLGQFPPAVAARIRAIVGDQLRLRWQDEQPLGSEGRRVLRPVPISDLLHEGGEQMDWIWHTYMPRSSLVLLAGAPKSGKSTLARHLAVSIASATSFLGRDVTSGPVLYLALEERRGDVRNRFAELHPGEVPLFVHTGTLEGDDATLASIGDFVAQRNIVLVVVDTLAQFWRVTDENDASRVTRSIAPLLDLARDSGAATLLLHHTRKMPGDAGSDIRGSSALFASVDVALLLRRDDGNPNRRVLEAFSRYDETPGRILIELDPNLPAYQCLGEHAVVHAAETESQVLAALTTSPQTTEEVTQLVRQRREYVSQALRSLFEHGKVHRAGRGQRGDPFRWSVDAVPSMYISGTGTAPTGGTDGGPAEPAIPGGAPQTGRCD